ncbi:MAG: hypothetical protein LBF27_28405 [Sphingobacterium sp.]|nr:hypothetical protein [Sphingobacterium sp.]
MLLIGAAGCSKSPSPIEPPIIDTVEKKIDYKNYDLADIASISNRRITDTLWNAKKTEIVGFKLEKDAGYEFSYNDAKLSDEPFINSFFSLPTYPQPNFASYQSKLESFTPEVRIQTADFNPIVTQKIAKAGDLDKILKDNLEKKGAVTHFEHRFFSYRFHSYENLKLIFTGNTDISLKFEIPLDQYKKLNNTGWLYYSYRPTIGLKIFMSDKKIKELFSEKELIDKNIVYVNRMEFGKKAFMAIDCSENVRELFSKLATSGLKSLTTAEVKQIDNVHPYFCFIGYSASDVDKVRKAISASDKIDTFMELALRNPETKSFQYPDIGMPAFYNLQSPDVNKASFDQFKFSQQINFTK